MGMIIVKITIDNKDCDAEASTHSAKFSDFDKIPEWIEKVKVFNEEKIARPLGFTVTNTKKETEGD
jgi:hypothetical protein